MDGMRDAQLEKVKPDIKKNTLTAILCCSLLVWACFDKNIREYRDVQAQYKYDLRSTKYFGATCCQLSGPFKYLIITLSNFANQDF